MEIFCRVRNAIRLVETELPVGFMARFDPTPDLFQHRMHVRGIDD